MMKYKSVLHLLLASSIVGLSLTGCTPADTELPVTTAVTPDTAPDTSENTGSMDNTKPSETEGSTPNASTTPATTPTANPSTPASSTPSSPSNTPSSSTPATTPESPSPSTSNVAGPKELRLTAVSKDNMTVVWDFPNLSEASSYTAYLDGEKVAENITSSNYTFRGLVPETTYTLEIQTVTTSGSSSPASISGTTQKSGSSGTGNFSGGGGGGGGGSSTPEATYIQVERLGQPAINEGLILSNDLLNLWNSVPPTVDLTDAASDIAAEATAVLTAIGNPADPVGNPVTSGVFGVNGLIGALLPDVLRIDTTLVSGYYVSGGGTTIANFNSSFRPIGGRQIMDDVIDSTLALAIADSVVLANFGDASPTFPSGADYDFTTGTLEQVERDGVAYADNHDPVESDFPFLAAPN